MATSKKSASKTKKAATKKIVAKKDAAQELHELFVDDLKDIYWAEKALTKALPIMSKNATSQKLKDALKKHLEETNKHIERLEEVFKSIDEKAVAKKCDAMQGLIDEAKSIMEETTPGAVRDAGIIGAAQKVEHYEIASYGTMATYAKLMGHKTALNLLIDTLKEEKQTDKDLTKLAKSKINLKAL